MSLNTKLVATYSKSLFQRVNAKQTTKKAEGFNLANVTSPEQKTILTTVDIVGEELVLIRGILVSSNKIKSIFKNPTYLESQKLNIILTLFPGLTSTTKSFLKVLAERNHLYLLPEISDEYHKFLLKFKNAMKVKIVVASPLSETFGNLLLSTLKSLTKANEVLLSVSYNPKLLGGMIVEYNSMAIDASILKEFSLFFSEI